MTTEKPRTLYLEGPAGTGKTTYGVAELKQLLASGVPPDHIMLLTPQRSYARPYQAALDPATWYQLEKATIGGLARKYVSLFWPLVVANRPFSRNKPPRFLTYEVAQYIMARVVSPLLEQGCFPELKIPFPRLYSQLLDNLNKAAANNFSMDELAVRLNHAHGGRPREALLTEDVLQAVKAYRAYCITHNLLDFSLYLALFRELVTGHAQARERILAKDMHLIVDNIEEDIPLAHDLVAAWLPRASSGLVIADEQAGYRRFLGASPENIKDLRQSCDKVIRYDEVHTASANALALGQYIHRILVKKESATAGLAPPVITLEGHRLHLQMIQACADRVSALITAGTAPQEIAIISPFLSQGLGYGVASRLAELEIPVKVHRPSRTLREEPVTRILITLASLAHPQWQRRPSHEDVSHLFHRLFSQCDLVRSSLLARGAYDPNRDIVDLLPFEKLDPGLRDRITYSVGEGYEALRSWVLAYREEQPAPIDHFFSQLFGEVLSQDGFGMHESMADGAAVARVVESAAKFRQAVGDLLLSEESPIGKTYLEMVERGVVSGYYMEEWDADEGTVSILPAHSFLLRNRPVQHQCWLDISSTAWHKRINQPLTNPYILSATWPSEAVWTDTWEQQFETERLDTMILGLVRRCSEEVHLFSSELSAYGQEQQGRLLKVLGRVTRLIRNERGEES